MLLEETLRSVAQLLSDSQFRSFGCECCLRLVPQFKFDAVLRELISFGQIRSVRPMRKEELEAMRKRSCPYYDLLYPGYGDISAIACAIQAGGFVAYTDNALEAAVGASVYTAYAVASKVAIKASFDDYPKVFDSVCEAESNEHKEILQKYLPQDFKLK